MYKFSAKSTPVLGIMAVFSILAFLAVENAKVDVQQDWYAEKLAAAEKAQAAQDYIKEHRLKEGIFVDDVNDPNETALIGQEYTLITTDRGYIESKLSATNPNFAAVIVQMLKEAALDKGDIVAVGFTGSFPGLNISVMAALETLGLKPLIITSVGASNWGANDPYFTWLDMEKLLTDGHIFNARSVAASIGGGADRGRGLSPEGRKLIIQSIQRNELTLINNNHLEKNIEQRMEIYDSLRADLPIKTYINVGGGIASLGNTITGKIVPAGLSLQLAVKNYPTKGVMVEMGKRNIPILHLLNIRRLAQKYGLPIAPSPLPDPGTGEIFVQRRYSMLVTFLFTLILTIAVLVVYFTDRKLHRLGSMRLPTAEKPTKS